MNRLPLPLAGFLICAIAVFAEGKEPKPLDQLSPAEKESYAKLLQEYKAAEAKRDGILQEKKKTDPAFERAAYWLDKEQPKTSTQFRQLEKKFLSANPDKKSKYRQWVSGYSALVANETADKEWNDVPSARPALLFLAEKMIEMEKERAKDRNTSGDAQKAGAVAIPELKGSDAEKWNQFRTYFSKRHGDVLIDFDVDALERELRIPKNLKNELHKEAGSLLVLYDTYYRFHLPPELTTVQKQIMASINELNKLRPGWETAEGFEYPAGDPRGLGKPATGIPSYKPERSSYLVVSICLILIVVLSAIFVLRRRRR
ncbi:MAG: hypothetical protein ABFC77_02645 [Thermoguttaceae bacterium]